MLGPLENENNLRIKTIWIKHLEETSTILGQEVAECMLEDVHVRAGYKLGIFSFFFILFYITISYFISFHFILLISFLFDLIIFLFYSVLFHFFNLV